MGFTFKGGGSGGNSVDSNALAGLENHIAKGLKITGTNGLNVDVLAGVIVANEVRKAIPAQTKTLDPIKTALLYADTNGNIDKINAQYPIDMIDNNTVGFWVFNKTGNIPNSAVVKSSIAVANDFKTDGNLNLIDGHCDKSIEVGNNSNSGYVSDNIIPLTGNSNRQISVMFTLDILKNSNNFIYSYGSSGTNSYFQLYLNSNGEICFSNGSTVYSTSYKCEAGKTYLVVCSYDGTKLKITVNGVIVFFDTATLTTNAGCMCLGRNQNAMFYSSLTLHYLKIRNALHSDEVIAKIANKLLLPCFYTDTDGSRKNITEILPANAVAIGIIKTNSTVITGYNNNDYQYGRREGAQGGNRRVFLGWKAFSAGSPYYWDNPFGARKVRLNYVWSQDANGKNEQDTLASPYYDGTASYGIYTASTPSNRISARTGSGGVCIFNGTWQTTGFIGVYAEVLE